MLPFVAPEGTCTVIQDSPEAQGIDAGALQLTRGIGVPLSVTQDCPAAQGDTGGAPNPVPLIITPIWLGPSECDRNKMAGETVNGTPLLATAPTVTRTFPVAAPVGTGTTMFVEAQLVEAAEIPLNVTALLP